MFRLSGIRPAFVLEAPSVYGISINDGLFLGPPAFCAPLGIVDINWFDTYLTGTIIPSLARDVDPSLDFCILRCQFCPFHKGLQDFSRRRIQSGVFKYPFLPSRKS